MTGFEKAFLRRMVSLRRIKRLNKERDSKSCEMSIEHDSPSRLHSRGSNERIVSAIVDLVQCGVLLYRIRFFGQKEAQDYLQYFGTICALSLVPDSWTVFGER